MRKGDKDLKHMTQEAALYHSYPYAMAGEAGPEFAKKRIRRCTGALPLLGGTPHPT